MPASHGNTICIPGVVAQHSAPAVPYLAGSSPSAEPIVKTHQAEATAASLPNGWHSKKMVQAIAATLGNPSALHSACHEVFERLKVPAHEDGGEVYEVPLDRCAQVLAHWDIPKEHVSVFMTVLRMEKDVVEDHELPAGIPYDTFSNVLVKVLRRVRDKHTSLKVAKLHFITQSSRRLEDDYVLRGYIGSGSFGECRWMEHKVTKEKFVGKLIKKDTAVPDEEIVSELDMMKQLDHPNVLRLYQWFESEDHFTFILEAAHGGDLKDGLALARNRGDAGLPEFLVRHIALQSLRALSYMHKQGVVHRDIKPANMLLDHRLGDPPSLADIKKLRVLIADFGVSEVFKPPDEAMALRGTLPYMAPEVLGGYAGPRADVWALGVVVQELISGKRPFQGDNQMIFYSCLRRQEPNLSPMLEANASESAVDFVKCLLIKERISRPMAKQALDHEWLEQVEEAPSIANMRTLSQGLEMCTGLSTMAHSVAACIATHVSPSKVKELSQIFTSLDKDHDGVLSRSELEKGLKEAGIVDDAQITLLSDSADIDRDGMVNYTELVASLLGAQGRLGSDRLEQAFAVFDCDHDGTISLEELHRMLNDGSPIQELLPDGTTVEGILKTIDTSHDGTISKQEFMHYINQQFPAKADSLSCPSRTPPPQSKESSVRGGATQGASQAVPDGELLSTIFTQIGALLRDTPHPAGATDAPDYMSLCAHHAQRLAEEHWLFTAHDLREMRSADWQYLQLPLKLKTLLQARLLSRS